MQLFSSFEPSQIFSLFLFSEEDTEIAGKLPDICTVYQAELVAIREAVKFLLSRRVSNATILICSDSMSSLQSIQNRVRQYWIAAEIRDLIDELQSLFNTTVLLAWVPAHCGIEGNEAADSLAKMGSAQETVSIELDMSLSVAAHQLVRSARFAWQLEAMRSVSEWSRNFVALGNCQLFADRHTSQFMTGHGLFNSYRFKLGMSTTPACCLCGHGVDSPEHALFVCPAFAALRHDTLSVIDLNGVADLPVLKETDTHHQFARFCRIHHQTKKQLIFN